MEHDKNSVFPSGCTWWSCYNFIKHTYICIAQTPFLHRYLLCSCQQVFCSPHLYQEHCCLHLDADLQVNGKTGQGVTNGKSEYDSYLKRLTFSLLCHCTL